MKDKRRTTSSSPYLTINELSEMWRCSRRHIERLLRKGELSKTKVASHTLILRAEALRYARSKKTK